MPEGTEQLLLEPHELRGWMGLGRAQAVVLTATEGRTEVRLEGAGDRVVGIVYPVEDAAGVVGGPPARWAWRGAWSSDSRRPRVSTRRAAIARLVGEDLFRNAADQLVKLARCAAVGVEAQSMHSAAAELRAAADALSEHPPDSLEGLFPWIERMGIKI